MARFYAHYLNTTQSALEAIDSSNAYTKRTVSLTPAGTARTNLITTRSTLSTSFYADIADNANKNGSLGIVVPADGYSNNGTTISGANIYTATTPSPAAVWQADPRIRPTGPIYIANTQSTIVDAWDVPTSEYNACRTAFQDYMNAVYTSPALTTLGSPYQRLGLDPGRTLASIWHDHELTYFAWDDFTPGAPTLNPLQPGSQSRTLVLDITLNWSWEYSADRLGNIVMTQCYLEKTDFPNQGTQYDLRDTSSVLIKGSSRLSSTGTLVARVPANTLAVGTYKLYWLASFRDSVIVSHAGEGTEYVSGNTFVTLTI